MQELLSRLRSLDPQASLALRVVACFDELIRGDVNSQALLGAAASLAGCPVGFRQTRPQRTMRVAPDGTLLASSAEAADGPDGWELVDEGDGLAVWLERDGPPQANDAIVLERLALAVSIRHGRARPDARRGLAMALDVETTSDLRRRAATQVGLSIGQRYRVVAVPLFATWGRHPDAPEDVVATSFGPIHVLVVPAAVTRIDASPVGIGVVVPVEELDRSLRTALVSLRLCAPPRTPQVLADEYGGLVELLADSSTDRPSLDVERLDEVMGHPWAVATLDALLRAASVREAARLAGVHHSTMQTRLDTLTEELCFDPLDGLGRARIGIAYLAWRLRHSTVLELPAPVQPA